MKHKKIKKRLWLVVAIIVIIILGVGFYFVQQNKSPKTDKLNIQTEQSLANQENKQLAEQNHLYSGDDFTMLPPSGWLRSQLPGTLVSYQNPVEKHPTGSAAEKINFRTYLAVSFDNSNGQTLAEIIELVKRQIQSIAPAAVLQSTTPGTIDNEPATFMEFNLTMQNIDFKVMMIIVLKGDKYFTISNNTTIEKWPEYQETFYNTASSFQFKY